MTGRREFLAACAAALCSRRMGAQSAPYRFDIHHHLFPPDYRSAIGTQGAALPMWTPAQSLAEMDKNAVEKSLVSLSPPGLWFGDAEQSRRLARIVNEYGARMASDHRGRFGLFAALPLPDIDGSLREIEYAFGTLKADGIGLMTSYADRWLGDATFAPVWQELNRRRAVVYTHPNTPACCGNLNYGVGPGVIEWATDTTRTAASLLFTGTAARYPEIRWILSHGGGTTPFLLSRFIREEAALKQRNTVLPRGLMFELRKFYYDTAQANHPGALDALLKMVPASQVLFGSDYPYRTFEEVAGGLATYGFARADRQAIERENAARLLAMTVASIRRKESR